jgi:hypothetical protein
MRNSLIDLRIGGNPDGTRAAQRLVTNPRQHRRRIPMTTRSSLTTALLLTISAAAAGCAADVTAPPDDPTDPTNPDNPDNQPVPQSPTGKFAMTSTFDLATNMPGTAGTVVNIFISATDDPDDPTKFIVEKLVGALPDGSIKTNLQSAIPFVSGYLNDRLLMWAPDLVTKVVKLGDGFGQIAHNFGMTGTLDIAANGKAVHTIDGLHFKVDTTELDFPFADYHMDSIKAAGVDVALSTTGKLTIGEHQLPLSYGKALRIGLDEMVIPMIDPDATTIADVLHDAIDCQAVGQYVYDAVGFGSPSTFESACNSGLTAGGGFIYNQIDNLDSSALNFTISGVARGVDKDKNGTMDDVQTGSWTGTLTYATTPAPLAPGAKFHGKRM